MSEHGQINSTTERWKIIQDTIKKNDFKNIVEIGTWKGMGSTLCIIESLSKDSKFISIESNKTFYDIAVSNLSEHINNVDLIYGTIVSYEDILDFVSELQLDNLRLQWLNEDLNNIKLCPNVLDIIPNNIDFLLLDGGEFSTYKEWIKLKDRVKVLAIDDIREIKTNKIYQELINDDNYTLIGKTDEGNGFCIFEKKITNIDFIQLNKFSKLHDGQRIIFCKTDYLDEEFEYIKNLGNDVILITGNSDYHIDSNRIHKLPNNVKIWYGQNICANHDKLVPIPLGLENIVESFRHGHGIGYYDRVKEKERLLKRSINKKPSKNIYSNFQISTNYGHRTPVMNICKNSNHIDWEEPNLSLENFFDKILDYKMVVCPAGNGVDTHRLWEVLYSNRVPITIKTGNFKIYELYEKLPIIILNDMKDLMDNDLIQKKYNEISIKNFNMELLNYNYWEQKIFNTIL